jgi:hypothetical protein
MDNIQEEEDSNERNQEITNKSHNEVEYAVVHENRDNQTFESFRELDENHEEVEGNQENVDENHFEVKENDDKAENFFEVKENYDKAENLFEVEENHDKVDENLFEVKENHDKVEENHNVLDENRDEIIESVSYDTFEYQEKVEKSSNDNTDDYNNNELSYVKESKTTIENGDKDSNIDSAIDVKHDSGEESPSVEDFGNKLRMWSTQSLNRSTYRQTSWKEEEDKFKTLRQIRRGNTKLLMEKFQFL